MTSKRNLDFLLFATFNLKSFYDPYLYKFLDLLWLPVTVYSYTRESVHITMHTNEATHAALSASTGENA